MKRKIVWASQHLEIDTMTGKFKDSSIQEPISDYDDDFNELNGQEIHNVISTPFGLWRINDTMNPYKQFKMWMAHINFNLSAKTANIIKRTPGVEVLSVLTRYRFLIGVGELFKIREVRTTIEQALGCSKKDECKPHCITDKNIKAEVDKLKKQLQKYNNWAIYVFPNGKIDFATDANGEKQYTDKLMTYRHAVDHSTGILIEKDNE